MMAVPSAWPTMSTARHLDGGIEMVERMAATSVPMIASERGNQGGEWRVRHRWSAA